MPDIDTPYDALQALPREVWLPALVNSVGDSAQRLLDVGAWLHALQAGELPPPQHHFGDPAALQPLREGVGALGLPPLCQGVPALAQQVMRSLLWHLDGIVDLQPRLTRHQAVAQVAQDFRDAWTLDRAGWEDALRLLKTLGDTRHLHWDDVRGRLFSRPWREALRVAALLPQLQPLALLIRRLGRSEHAPPPPDLKQPQPAAARRHLATVWREMRLPDAPGELKGIRHSDRLARMLASEAAQIRHPVLHKLWRARLAEARLLTFEGEAVWREPVPDPAARTPPRAAGAVPQTLQRGPMLLCVDTSGSMQGAPEAVAKAVVLEVMRVAHQERRGCRLIAFGGPGELAEHQLDLGPEGLAAVLALMGQSFDGGTDLQTPIARAIELVHEARWAAADLLIVSDGAFGCTAATLDQLDRARERFGLRVQGILVGDRETLGLLEVCDDIFWLRDWRRFESDTPQPHGFVPVHTAGLTALYFPNALSERARRRRPR